MARSKKECDHYIPAYEKSGIPTVEVLNATNFPKIRVRCSKCCRTGTVTVSVKDIKLDKEE